MDLHNNIKVDHKDITLSRLCYYLSESTRGTNTKTMFFSSYMYAYIYMYMVKEIAPTYANVFMYYVNIHFFLHLMYDQLLISDISMTFF